MKSFLKKRVQKFKQQSLFGKILDILLVVLILLLVIPATRKELMTYTSKVRMYLTSVNDNENDASPLEGKNSLLFEDSEGNQYSLNDFNDKPVFINYWATWCPPCRAEMPTLQKLYDDYGDQVQFLFISNESFNTIQNYINQQGYDLPVYKVKSRPSGSLAYQVLPTSLLISEDDKVVFKKVGAVNWHSKDILKIFERVSSKG
jgi:thiol-disulfide isomerase/thioredoxin